MLAETVSTSDLLIPNFELFTIHTAKYSFKTKRNILLFITEQFRILMTGGKPNLLLYQYNSKKLRISLKLNW